MQTILILGTSGMLGNATYRLFADSDNFSVVGTARSASELKFLPASNKARIVTGVDVSDADRLTRLFGEVRPDVVINCIGVIKQLAQAKDPVISITINALLPHRLADLCAVSGARLVQVSTDCVFDGQRGFYKEADLPNADDLYGRTKLLGEVDYPHGITLRTSIIGHEIGTAFSLIDWFLSQRGPTVRGYRRAIYSGFPTVELARIIRDVVIPRPGLRGLWHVASSPISKYDLLHLVARTYGKQIEILPDDSVAIDRSLDGSRFEAETGYTSPSWPDLVERMHAARPSSIN